MAIPLFASSLESHQPRIAERLAEVAASGRYILGPEVAAFERAFADYLGVKHCVGVANGTDALEIGLRALGVGRGDEVVVPSFTFYATAEAVAAIGARPVFCDIDLETFCVSAETVERTLTPRTKAIVPVHLFGNVAPVADLRAFGVPLLEDAAQAAGAATAAQGADAATFSFFPAKNLPCLGDGGAIATDRDDVAELARRLRFHGSEDKITFVEVGYNSRLDELQAAVLRILLPELDGWVVARRAAAAAYESHGIGAHVAPQRQVPGGEHAYHLYVVRSEHPDELRAALEQRGIEARRYYRVPVHRQPAMAEFGADANLPATDEVARTHLALPMGTQLRDDQVREVVEACASGST
jgi:dTDP-3-amino-3,4,6-trideoxy-alpha-D-glucose transaminase